MDWLLCFFALVGMYLIGRKQKWGWVVKMVYSLLWVYYALHLDPVQYGLVLYASVNFVICGMSAWKWFREEARGDRKTANPDW